MKVDYQLVDIGDGETYCRLTSSVKCSESDVLDICIGTLWKSKALELLALLEHDHVRFACNDSFIAGSGTSLALYVPEGEEGEDFVLLDRSTLQAILKDWIAFFDHQTPFIKHY